MSLWLALILPALPVQLAERAVEQAGPLVVVEGPAQRPVVAFCNQAAADCGVVRGHKLAAAQAMAQPLLALARNTELEQDTLLELASWAYQFSAQISQRCDLTQAVSAGLLLETGGSRQLFGGHARLHRFIECGLTALGFKVTFGYAPTPQAAWWIAAARASGLRCPDVFESGALEKSLAPLPLRLTSWDAATLDSLHALGLATLGDVLVLPRDQLNRRFGTALLEDLDRACGHLPDPQPLFTPPATFHARLDLPADVSEAEQLMFPAHRLLRSLEGFLRGRDAGATALHFAVTHPTRRARAIEPTVIPLALAAPERDARRLAQLFAERLSRVVLPEPAVTLALAVDHLQAFAPLHASLLPPAPGASNLSADTGWQQLAETLHARLGSERVFQLQAVDDHRPEHAWRALPLVANLDERRSTAPAGVQRPLLILPQPAPLESRDETPVYAGALRLVAGPERIESGWWDLGSPTRRSVFRDYFVARNTQGQTLWVYRELAAPRRWFLHGFFA
jgi:protein ImuB